jgi:GNAT-family acetyltransferase (TIGR03103 family)
VTPVRPTDEMKAEVALECGWGRLIFGQTFEAHAPLAKLLRSEKSGRRDVCLYVRDPHVLVGMAPHEFFVDPSYTYRLWLHRYSPAGDPVAGVQVRKMRDEDDAESINRVYAACGMLAAPSDRLSENQHTRVFTYLVAEDVGSGNVVGTVTGVDHVRAFSDPQQGTSLWCLAVDPQCTKPRVGEALVRTLAEKYQARGRAYLDLSVLHDNMPAISLYEKLDFERVPVFCVKRKNPVNEPLFTAPINHYKDLNPYARIIVDEARRRGITVEVLDAEWGEMRLMHGTRRVVTRESLSELTSALAFSRCDDKRVTRRVLSRAGLRIPRGREATFDDKDAAFLREIGRVVVKPARAEQGRGVTVGVKDEAHLDRALEAARAQCPDVILEEECEGHDLRIVVIGHRVVAAAVRQPPMVVGTGQHTVQDLIEAQSRRREAATGGESHIPVDEATEDTVRDQGFELEGVLPKGETVLVRRTANLHTGGTIHDVTEQLHPALAEAAERASRALDIPVTGLDMLVPAVDGPAYVIIEANERPGLANHEPQPTTERFIDLLFPGTRGLPRVWEPGSAGADHHQPGTA